MERIWRWVSPSTLVLALLVAPMPWIEVHCTSKNQAGETTTLVMTVSGLQAAVGGVSCNGKSEINPDKASGWMQLYLVIVVAGILLGYRMRMGKARCVALSMCAGTALVALGLAILFHFGMMDAVKAALQTPAPAPPRTRPGGGGFTHWLLIVYSLHLLSLVTVAGDWLWLRWPRPNLPDLAVSSP